MNDPPKAKHEKKGQNETYEEIVPRFAVTEISLAVTFALYAEAGRQDARDDLA